MRTAVLVSGTGTNLGALLAAEAEGEIAPAEIVVVVSNRSGVGALEVAQRHHKPHLVIDHKQYGGRVAFENALCDELARHRVELVVLAGFMRVLTSQFLDRYTDRVLNIHPSLLPAFPGVNAQRQAFAHGVKIAGCTVHLCSPDVDGGPIVLQAAVPVLEDDDEETLRARILAEEHELLPRAVRLLAQGRLSRSGRRVTIASP